MSASQEPRPLYRVRPEWVKEGWVRTVGDKTVVTEKGMAHLYRHQRNHVRTCRGCDDWALHLSGPRFRFVLRHFEEFVEAAKS